MLSLTFMVYGGIARRRHGYKISLNRPRFLATLFHILTTETEKYVRESGFIGNPAVLKYSVLAQRVREKQTDGKG